MVGLRALLGIITIPFLILNLLAGLVGGIWLAIAGYWSVVGMGLAAMFVGVFAISILLIPSMLLALPIASERTANNLWLTVPAAVISCLYLYGVMAIWAVAIFFVFVGKVDANAALPAGLWSYAAATAAWTFMAQKEQQAGNDQSVIAAFFNQVGCGALIIYSLTRFGDLYLGEMALWFAVPMSLCLVVQLLNVLAMRTRPSY